MMLENLLSSFFIMLKKKKTCFMIEKVQIIICKSYDDKKLSILLFRKKCFYCDLVSFF